MSILNDIIDMLYSPNCSANPFEPKSFIEKYNRFYDKHLSTDDLDKEFENYLDLNDLIDETRSIAFCAGFRTATQLWLEGMRY